MFLKEIILDGFKSYANRTVVQGWSLPQAGTELLRHGFNPHLEVLAHDICFYTRELRREPLKQALHRVATT